MLIELKQEYIDNIELKQEYIDNVLTKLPRVVSELLINFDLFLGGGFIRDIVLGESPKDIDLFCKNIHSAELGLEYIKSNIKIESSFKTDNAITVKFKNSLGDSVTLQFITRWLYDDCYRVVDDFDFTIAKAGIWYDHNREKFVGICDARFESDVLGKILVYCAPIRSEEVMGCVLRMRKFLQRGYIIHNDSLCKILARVFSGWGRENTFIVPDEECLRDDMKNLIERVYDRGRHGY